jgi:hypothetical protein
MFIWARPRDEDDDGEWLWRKPEYIKTKIKKNKIKNINFLFFIR